MNLYCLSDYHNEPYGLHFVAGPIDVDDTIAEFLLRDAPENFIREAGERGAATRRPDAVSEAKALAAPPKDKAVKTTNVKARK